jgi:hypothetical protein
LGIIEPVLGLLDTRPLFRPNLATRSAPVMARSPIGLPAIVVFRLA